MPRHWISAVTYGFAASILIMLASAFLLASLLRFTSFTENNGSLLPLFISIIALFIGGVISGSKLRARGILIGTVTGLVYCLFSFFFQFLGLHLPLEWTQVLYFLVNICAAAVGGVVGVNLFSARHS